MIDFFRPPVYESIEQTQKAGFLHITLLVIAGVCIILGFQNMSGESHLDVILFLLGGISFLCIPFNRRGYFTPVAIFIATLVLGIITFSLIDGLGLKDAGLIAYPIFIIFTTFLFNKKASFIATLLSIGSVVFVYSLDRMGYLEPAVYSNEIQLIVICVLLAAAGLLLWAVMDNWERILQNLRETYDLTLIGWGKALDYRDRETEGHSQRVVEMTVGLAKRLGVSGRKLDDIRRGALLHDIGKIAVPDEILHKDRDLSEDEWKVVKMHPFHARNLIANIPFLESALEIPYSHHERWDGSGYPEGLSKQDIPFAARIFAVVDVWDAITSNRLYRRAWTGEKARDYIRDQSGILFDPQVVEAFLEFIEPDINQGSS